MANPYWPLFDLVIRTPLIELRVPDEGGILALTELANTGVHPPDYMPFGVPWTRGESPAKERGALQHYWRNRATLAPDDWNLSFMIVADGEVVGTQGISAKTFAQMGEVHTGSWLAMKYQGRGIGKEMRTAVLHFAFAGLGAHVATSSAWYDNVSSIGVSRSVGYEDNGWDLLVRDDVPTRQLRFWMERSRWEQRRRDDITIDGLEPCLDMLGAATPPREPDFGYPA